MLRLMPFTFDVAPLVAQLEWHPELWNDFDLRTNHPQSPHRELDDIFVRYNARENFKGDRHAFNEPHESVWWPAAERLPAAKTLALDLMRHVEATRLGMVLVTRIPPHKTCYPHIDIGHHATYYEKFAIQIKSSANQAFHVESESLSADPGESYRFDNSKTHWVTNESDHERITLIVCCRMT